MSESKRILIVGGGGQARVVIDAARCAGHDVLGVLSRDAAIGSDVLGCPVVGSDADAPNLIARMGAGLDGLVVAIGDNATREAVVSRLRAANPALAFVAVVHPSAIVASSALIGPGAMIHAGAVVGVQASIGAHCIVNTNASVDHDDVLEDFASVAPGATLGGTVRVGRAAAVCLGAKVIQGLTIGARSVVGAGATVVRDVPPEVVVMGTPARVVRAVQSLRTDGPAAIKPR